MKTNELMRKLMRFVNDIAQRIKQVPARTAEVISGTGHFIRTGKPKMQDDILRYANETHVVSDVHPDDLIFRFVMKSPGFKTKEEAVRYYFYDGANSAKKLNNLVFSELGMSRTAETSLLEFASGYGCVTRACSQ